MSKTFIPVAKLTDVPPGKMKCVKLDGRKILLANVEGEIHAADETCTHEDASLCLGSLKGPLVRCPLHGSRFDLRTGAALEDPAEQPLAIYPVRIEGDTILIGTQPKEVI